MVHILIEKVANGGNLLLNIGPTGDGRIPVIMQQRLADIGGWLEVNGESIYQTEAWSKRPATMKEDQVFFTRKGTDLYVICTAWQSSLEISDLARPTKVSLLGSDQEVGVKTSKGKVELSSPQITPANIPCNYAWVYKLEGVFEP